MSHSVFSERRKELERLALRLRLHLYDYDPSLVNNYYYNYLIQEFCTIVAMAAQWGIFQYAFQGDFVFLGLNVGTYFYYTHILGQLNFANPLDLVFPLNTGCTFKFIGPSGEPSYINSYCTMSMNGLYLYLIPGIWFLLASLSILMVISFGVELLMLSCLPIRRGFMMIATAVMKGFKYRWEYDAIWENATPAEFHLIRIYSNNVDPQIFRLFLIAIATGNRNLSATEKIFLDKIA